MKLSIGFSPCPNDTFIFDALVNGKIDTGDLELEVYLEDVQTLNEWSINGRLDISKISYAVLPQLLDQYIMLPAGGALGKGVGPLLISKNKPGAGPAVEISDVAIPGKYTTANMLFTMAYPMASQKKYMPFSTIEEEVLSGRCIYGVIIHENRFTYMQKGLFKHMDLGEYWEKETGLPIPLGGIVMKRRFEPQILAMLNRLIRQSVEYAFRHYPSIPPYVAAHSQEMEESVMRQHIDLYVNQYSVDPGPEGRKAVERLLTLAGPTTSTSPIFAEAD